MRDEIGPFISLLLERADKHLERQSRRIETLKARSDLNAGRLSQAPDSGARAGAARERAAAATSAKGKGRELGAEAALRAKVLRQRKEALKYSVERLELEVLQKERELRLQLENVS